MEQGRLRNIDTIVADDMRFVNEAEACKAHNGLIIKVTRPGAAIDLTHASEREIGTIDPDFEFTNDDTVEHLQQQVTDALDSLLRI
jgi:hypothetical protein